MTSKQASTSLFNKPAYSASTEKQFANLVDRTVNRLEKLLLLTDPALYSEDGTHRIQLGAVRSLVTGLFLAHESLPVGATFHLKKGLKSSDIIPAGWQGLCSSALRYLIVYNSQSGSRSLSEKYARQLDQLLAAMQTEAALRSEHDVLYATARGSSLRNDKIRSQWLALNKSCSRALKLYHAKWVQVSLSSIRLTALQATGQYEKMLVELKSSPLPRAEVNLMTAVTNLELGHLIDAGKHALAARSDYKPGTSNWLTSSDVAIRSYMLSGNIEEALDLIVQLRHYPKLYTNEIELDAWLGMLEAYCKSYQQMHTSKRAPRRGRPPERHQRFKTQLRNTSTTRQVYISLSVWQLIDAKAQMHEDLFEQTILNMLRYVRRRKDLRKRHRFGVFVEFIYRHRFGKPTVKELQQFRQDLKALGTVYSNGEIIAYEILAKVLTDQ